MKIPSFIWKLPALTVLMGLLLAPATAWSVQPECTSVPPAGPAVCFIEEPFFGVFFETPAASPEQMLLLLIADPTDDFVISFPDGGLFVHTPEREGDMIWCPFPFSEYDFKNPQPECVFGTARLQANGYIELSGDLGCPCTSHLVGSGVRGIDGATFTVSTDILRVPSNQDPSGWKIVEDDITATQVP
jgi:hypothetical protein